MPLRIGIPQCALEHPLCQQTTDEVRRRKYKQELVGTTSLRNSLQTIDSWVFDSNRSIERDISPSIAPQPCMVPSNVEGEIMEKTTPVEPFSDIRIEENHVWATLRQDPTVQDLDLALYLDGSGSMAESYKPGPAKRSFWEWL